MLTQVKGSNERHKRCGWERKKREHHDICHHLNADTNYNNFKKATKKSNTQDFFQVFHVSYCIFLVDPIKFCCCCCCNKSSIVFEHIDRYHLNTVRRPIVSNECEHPQTGATAHMSPISYLGKKVTAKFLIYDQTNNDTY